MFQTSPTSQTAEAPQDSQPPRASQTHQDSQNPQKSQLGVGPGVFIKKDDFKQISLCKIYYSLLAHRIRHNPSCLECASCNSLKTEKHILTMLRAQLAMLAALSSVRLYSHRHIQNMHHSSPNLETRTGRSVACFSRRVHHDVQV